ncbi:MAG: hypothetical protein GY822_00520 [Deltaproteobacteria bacterium]|nr:hypothetical protein [Deltaproteobacteria bacterium]
MSSSTSSSKLSPWLLWLAFPLLCLVVGGLFLPRPKNIAEQRAIDKENGTQLVFVKPPPTGVVVDVNFQDKLRVVGLNPPDAKISTGRTVKIDTVFEALSSMKKDWEIFMHIDKAGGENYRIHGDHHPANGRMKTSAWAKGDFILDQFSTRVPFEAPSGKYDIWMGFYSGKTRLKFKSGDKVPHDDENRIKLGSFIVN